jgi:two-component system C4-dicarboxylate transport response regulator DctD
MDHAIKVVVIEDDQAVRIGCTQALQLAGFGVVGFDSAEKALPQLAPGAAMVVVSDVRLPGMDGLSVLQRVMELDSQLPVILMTGHGDIGMAVGAMRSGAYDFIEKPFPSERLVEVVGRAVEKRRLCLELLDLRQTLKRRQAVESSLLGHSPLIERIRQTIAEIADTSVSVVIRGETGTGKELVARSLHQSSSQAKGEFVAVNCGGVPEQLFDSEIFGHEAGAFTGAVKRRIGRIEWASKGTLFLDEIESMPMTLQVKLLRVLQERTFERLGSNQLLPVECRVIAASQSDLGELVEQQRFRADLYYRLNVATIDLPPLRDRREDIPLLFEHFVVEAATRFSREAPIASTSQLAELMAHQWPGNVRELHNVADRFVLGLLGDQFKLLKSAPLPQHTLVDQVSQFERAVIEDALRRHHGNAAAASDALGVPKKTLYDKLHRLHLVAEDFRDE